MSTVRRHRLAPPRAVVLPVAPPLPDGRDAAPRRQVLDAARPATRRVRRLFDPARGWFRRLERAGSHWLSRHVYPRIPGMSLIYGPQLRRGLTLGECEVPLRGLDPELCGLRVLLVTDLHAGAFLSARALGDALDRVVACRPDLVLIGGDVATARVDEVRVARDALRRLTAPLGVWAVLGNHDHYTGDPDAVARELETAGIEVLHNRGVVVRRGDASLGLAGIDDALIGSPDLAAALDGLPRPTVLLSHNPDVFFDAAARGVDLVLSGHTHAGQVRVPGLGVLVRQSRFRLDEGHFRHGDAQLVVSRGLGVVGVPVRVACPPEAVLLTLRAAGAAAAPV